MKIAYIKPTTVVIEVKAQPLMVVSGDPGNAKSVTIENDFKGNESDILSRRGRSIWDDEDDDYDY